MSSLLAIDSATDALSLAFQRGADLRVCHEVMPRRHQQALIERLHTLLDGQALSELELDAVAYGRGPGSFTGLRIAAAFVQGLAFSLGLPVIGLSTLEVQACTLLRRTRLPEPCVLLSSIDARIGQLYAAFYLYRGERLQPLGEAHILRAQELALPAVADRSLPLIALGSGTALIPDDLLRCAGRYPDILPEARDMLPLASRELAEGNTLDAVAVSADYLQPPKQWKTIAEQGGEA